MFTTCSYGVVSRYSSLLPLSVAGAPSPVAAGVHERWKIISNRGKIKEPLVKSRRRIDWENIQDFAIYNGLAAPSDATFV